MISIKKIVSNSNFQSILFGLSITIIVMLVWNTPFKKYNIVLNPLAHTSSKRVHWFAGDFNGDGTTERIRCFNGINSKSMDIVHYDEKGSLTDHWHIYNSEWNYNLTPKVFDIDNDGTQELLFFTVRNDSIFFNAFNLVSFKLTINNLYFNTFARKLKTEYAYSSTFYQFGDFDKDGNNELFFSFDSGFGLYPRGIFKIEFPSLKITASPTEYMTLGFSSFKDLNSDGIPEIIASCGAPYNSTSCSKYTDTIVTLPY